jgi:hypothetical protein
MSWNRTTRNGSYSGTPMSDALSDLMRIKNKVEPLVVSPQKAHRLAMGHAAIFARTVMASTEHRQAFDRLTRDIPSRRDAGRWVVLVKYLGLSETKSTVARLAKEIGILARRPESDRELLHLVVQRGVKALIAEAEHAVRRRSHAIARTPGRTGAIDRWHTRPA